MTEDESRSRSQTLGSLGTIYRVGGVPQFGELLQELMSGEAPGCYLVHVPRIIGVRKNYSLVSWGNSFVLDTHNDNRCTVVRAVGQPNCVPPLLCTFAYSIHRPLYCV